MIFEKNLTRQEIINSVVADKNEDRRGRPKIGHPVVPFYMRGSDEEWSEFKHLMNRGVCKNTRDRYLFFLNAMKNQ